MSLATVPSREAVLLVEDHGLITFGLTYALRDAGYDTVACSTPEPDHVLAVARRAAPVLAMVDLQFGGDAAEGIDLIEPLRAIGVPTIVLTGVTEQSVHGECLERGAVGVVSKTHSFDQVVDRIRAALASEPVNSLRDREDMLAAIRARRAEEQLRLGPFRSLSGREAEVLDQLVQGRAAEAIAASLFVSMSTVRMHIQRILRKLDVSSQVAAVAKSASAGWTIEKHQSC